MSNRNPVTGRLPRVMLILPNQRWALAEEWSIHPYAICLLAAMIRDTCEVRVIDANCANLTETEVSEKIAAFCPDIVGVSVLANAFKEAAFRACQLAKSHDNTTVTVLGGVFVTTRPEAALASEFVDYGVLGEGEFVFGELISYITGDTATLPSEGIAFRDGGKQCTKPQQTFIKNLDQLPFPDYSFVTMTDYLYSFRKSVDAPRALPYGKIVTSRGCPVGCIFCQVEYISGRKTRYKSVERTLEEIQSLIDAYQIRALEFDDDNLLGDPLRAKKLFKIMSERNWDLVWNAMNVSAFSLDTEMLELMKASKCQYLSIAIESGSPRVLKEIIHKPVDLKHARNMIASARALGIDTTALFVIGFPGETWDEIRQTIDVAATIGADYIKINVATAFPGTKLHALALETGSIAADFDYDSIAWGKAGISTPDFSARQLTMLRILEWDRINFSSPDKKDKIAEMMNISASELDNIRKNTLEQLNAL